MKHIFFSFLVLKLASCVPPSAIQNSLLVSVENDTAPISYLHDSKTSNCLKQEKLIVELTNNALDSLTTVSTVYSSGKLLNTKLNLNIRLGQSSLEDPYNDFFINSLIEESKRTACFEIAKAPTTDSAYHLMITIDICETNSLYERITSNSVSNVIIRLGPVTTNSTISEIGYPATTNLIAIAQLEKANRVITRKSYIINRTQPFLADYTTTSETDTGFDENGNVTSTSTYITNSPDFIPNMVESLSLSTKQCIEEIIADLNKSIKK